MNKKIGIDIGSRYIRTVLPAEPPVYDEEPAVLAFGEGDRPLAFGRAALTLSERIPGAAKTVFPFSHRNPPDPQEARAVFSFFLRKMNAKGADLFFSFAGERDAEAERILVEAAQEAGAADVLSVDAAYAAAIGCGVGGVSEAAVVNIGSRAVDMVCFLHAKPAVFGRNAFSGETMDQAIASYIFKKYRLTVSPEEAERVKRELGTLSPASGRKAEITVMRQAVGLPKKLTVTEEEISSALEPVFDELADEILAMIRSLSCEPVKIILTGGGALLAGLAPALTSLVCIPVEVAENPAFAVTRGLGQVIRRSSQKRK